MRLYAQGATVTEFVDEAFEDEYGFAYRLDSGQYLHPQPPPTRTAPTFDRDGYPTDETLTLIEQWPIFPASNVQAGEDKRHRGSRACLDFVVEAWDTHYGSVSRTLSTAELSLVKAQRGEQFIRFATGGWSVNESLISALNRNTVVHGATWRLTVRGGLHIYRY